MEKSTITGKNVNVVGSVKRIFQIQKEIFGKVQMESDVPDGKYFFNAALRTAA
jgi:hypothetical protein